MIAQVHVLSGARAGLVLTLAGETSVVGRHADAAVRFDPDRDLQVSARHATLTQSARGWFVRDLDSRNGTWVNGQRISTPTLLRNNDRITFGHDGPEVQFRLISIPTRHHTRAQGAIATGSIVVLALMIGTWLLSERRENAVRERERIQMQQRTDSVLQASARTVRSLEGQVQALADALRRSQAEVGRARIALRQAEMRGDAERVPRLKRQLDRATATLNRQKRAAGLNFHALQRANRSAVALVYVESQAGEVATGTAFAVRPDATLLTNRHVIAGVDGLQSPRRIAVQFSDSEQVWPARILRISPDADLAVLKVDNIIGRVPTIRSLNLRPDTLARGSPVAWIGFPLGGGSSPSDKPSATNRFARPVLSAGVLNGVAAGRLEVEGYGAEGASGSPFFDAGGEVIGVLLGGRTLRGRNTVYGIPASAAARLLRDLP